MNCNTVELIGIYGSDQTIAQSAWTSTNRELTNEKISRIEKLINMLAKEGHHTPFEKSSLHFLCTVDVATQIQILKHRIGVSVNSESARYKELKDDKFYSPVDWTEEEKNKHVIFCEFCIKEYHETLNRLISQGISRNRAKESARFKLPYASQYVLDIMFNFRSFIHFQKLRNDEHSQLEIRELAETMLSLVKEKHCFDISLNAFGY